MAFLWANKNFLIIVWDFRSVCTKLGIYDLHLFCCIILLEWGVTKIRISKLRSPFRTELLIKEKETELKLIFFSECILKVNGQHIKCYLPDRNINRIKISQSKYFQGLVLYPRNLLRTCYLHFCSYEVWFTKQYSNTLCFWRVFEKLRDSFR